MTLREPLLTPIALDDLRPTQITVGFAEVAQKREVWRRRAKEDGDAFLGRHMIPVVRGAKGRLFVIDNHHLGRALLEEGVREVAVTVVAELSHLAKDEFWVFCDNRGWCHPYDAEGERQDVSLIPKRLTDMPDDPYRSLAGALRRAGGFAKDTTPFSEFTWADFLRRRVKRRLVEADLGAALKQALNLARSGEADHLPGRCGPAAPDLRDS